MSLIEYRPAWAQHVVGTYAPMTRDEDGVPQPQRVLIRCEKCGEEWQAPQCYAPRNRVATFARVHLHADPFARKV